MDKEEVAAFGGEGQPGEEILLFLSSRRRVHSIDAAATLFILSQPAISAAS